jgi:hypothetical protein
MRQTLRYRFRMWRSRRWERRVVARYPSDNSFDAYDASVALQPYASSALKLAHRLLKQPRGGM